MLSIDSFTFNSPKSSTLPLTASLRAGSVSAPSLEGWARIRALTLALGRTWLANTSKPLRFLAKLLLHIALQALLVWVLYVLYPFAKA